MQNFTFKLIENNTYAAVGYQGDEPDVVIPDTYEGKPVTVLYDGLFRDHPEITSVKIPDAVTDIGSFVFDGCTGLTKLTLPAQLNNLWRSAFLRSSIEELELPENMRSIVSFTFKDCRNLKRFVCNKGLRKVYAWAFAGCDSLTDFVPGDETDVSPKAFEDKEPEVPLAILKDKGQGAS